MGMLTSFMTTLTSVLLTFNGKTVNDNYCMTAGSITFIHDRTNRVCRESYRKEGLSFQFIGSIRKKTLNDLETIDFHAAARSI